MKTFLKTLTMIIVLILLGKLTLPGAIIFGGPPIRSGGVFFIPSNGGFVIGPNNGGQIFTPLSNSASGGGMSAIEGFIYTNSIAWFSADIMTSNTLFTNFDATVPVDSTNPGRRVGAWLDQSSAGTNHLKLPSNLAHPTDERRPIYTNGLPLFNNKPALLFGEDAYTAENRSWLQGLTNFTSLGTNGITIVAAASYLRNSSEAYAVLLGTANAAGSSIPLEWRIDNQTTNMQSFIAGAVGPNVPMWATTNRGQSIILRYANATGAIDHFKNGTNGSPAGTGSLNLFPNTNFWAIGKRAQINPVPTSQYWEGAIAEVIVFPRPLSNLEVSNVNYYVTNKYGFGG